jgi:hypothetical protein
MPHKPQVERDDHRNKTIPVKKSLLTDTRRTSNETGKQFVFLLELFTQKLELRQACTICGKTFTDRTAFITHRHDGLL